MEDGTGQRGVDRGSDGDRAGQECAGVSYEHKSANVHIHDNRGQGPSRTPGGNHQLLSSGSRVSNNTSLGKDWRASCGEASEKYC